MNFIEFWNSIHEAIAELLGIDDFDVFIEELNRENDLKTKEL